MSRWSAEQLKARAKSASEYRKRAEKDKSIVCSKCGNQRTRNKCNKCQAEKMKIWRAKQSPEKKASMIARSRAWAREKGMDKVYNLRHHYGITVDDYNRMRVSQNNVCAICGKEEPRINKKTGKRRDLAVDHCHKTDKIRALLCGNCNGALGFVNDDIKVLANMINYIEKYKD